MLRPHLLNPLFASPESLSGLGPKRARLFEKLCGMYVKDLLFLKPLYFVDRRLRLGALHATRGEIISLRGQVDHHVPPHNPRQPYRIHMVDETGSFTLTYFRASASYLTRLLPEGSSRLVSGKVEFYQGKPTIIHPDYVLKPEDEDRLPSVEPIYPLTTGLTQKRVGETVRQALSHAPHLPEWQDEPFLRKKAWPSWKAALNAWHTPEPGPHVQSVFRMAEDRLAYDELLAHQLTLALARHHRRHRPGRSFEGKGENVLAVLRSAPFRPTQAQKRVFEDIAQDMAAPRRMMRLLHGDVGAGKTFVAALAAARACETGAQVAMMAPTEILARQLAHVLHGFLKPAGLKTIALTGRDKGQARRNLLERIKQGDIHVVCGTHALFQEDVSFHDLGLVIIDEQHRFGVNHRLNLMSKGTKTDVLLMTATPIPRTLALAVYGDLDVSRLFEKPAGRPAITTRLAALDRLDDVIESLERALARGESAYWVCPAVEETGKLDLAAVTERWRTLAARLGEDRVALVHGRLKPPEKEQVAEDFKQGKTRLLVATTVIEVGIDAPKASIMIVEQAERFGLAQLHQLRGRVGRGHHASSCLLLYKSPLSQTAKARLEAIRATQDGFALAEEDWRLRGSGDLSGLRQSGLPSYKIVDLTRHKDLLETASRDARLLLEKDPKLETQRGKVARLLLYLFEQDEGLKRLSSG